MDKHEVFAALKRMGAVRAEVEFSGGNDEGGVDMINFYGPNNATLDINLPDNVYEERDYSRSGPENGWRGASTGVWIFSTWDYDAKPRPAQYKRAATPEEIAGAKLRDALGGPVESEYGSFAGEFSVSGTVTWDVAEGTCIMSKSEQVWSDGETIEF